MQALLQELDEAIAGAEAAKVSAKYGKKCRKKLLSALQALQSEAQEQAHALPNNIPFDDAFMATAKNQDCCTQAGKASNLPDPLADSAQTMQWFNLNLEEVPPDEYFSPLFIQGKENRWRSSTGNDGKVLLQVLLPFARLR